MRIPEHIVAKIHFAADIAEVVSDYLPLKKRGSNLVACCPFHDEKTPSFTVTPSKGIYKCFGCGEGGGAVNFVMRYNNMNYPEALELLAEKYDIDIETTPKTAEEEAKENTRKSISLINNDVLQFFKKALNLGHRSYLEHRFIDLKKFPELEIGFAYRGYAEDLLKATWPESMLVKAGLIDDEGRQRFNNRIMIPIHDHRGNLIAFGGRTMRTADNIPKYINSPETVAYDKSKVLFGLNFAKQHIRKIRKAYLVEGYFDVFQMVAHGFKETVAPCGTSLTNDQAKLIKRFADTVTCIFDGDIAGVRAFDRALPILLEAGLKVRVVFLPEGQDPDSFLISEGREGFEYYLMSYETDGIVAMIQRAKFERMNVIDVQEKVPPILELINKCKGEMVKAAYAEVLRDYTGVPVYPILNDLEQTSKR